MFDQATTNNTKVSKDIHTSTAYKTILILYSLHTSGNVRKGLNNSIVEEVRKLMI